MSYYIGYVSGGKFELFTSKKKPTEQSHGHKYMSVWGPHRNRVAAVRHESNSERA